MSLTLASTSPIRRFLLESAGLTFDVAAPNVDEDVIKRDHEGSGADLALTLARAKALSTDRPGGWVIGSDSTLSVDGRLFSKPRDRDDAARHLAAFSNRDLFLSSAVALAHAAAVEWSMVDTVTLRVRDLSPAFIESYLDAEWPDVAYCVGVFRMEGRGVTLFDAVEGSHFTVLGLPLLPLLGALRKYGVMAS